ncbi:MAG TPA: NAD(P)H-dependent oxidoreductase [Bdellovibrionales bacterium]|nr:NAD(P)H-dependent oxidoreductase [Bdellovibrionales bacterium]
MPNSTPPKILVFAGSLRRGSFNKKLARIAAESVRKAGAQVTHIELNEFPMPLYDGDLEASEGIPEPALRFKELMKSHDGFLIVSPEYNSSIPGTLKNALDWASRSSPGEPALAAYDGKIAALMSASPGALGGLRGLVHLRAMLGNIKTLVIPEQQAVSKANEAFDDEGRLKDPKTQAAVDKVAARLVELAAKLRA